MTYWRFVFFVLVLVCALALATLRTQAGPVLALTDNLVSCWEMDEESGTRADSAGNYDLTDNNTVGAVLGVNAYAADFTASDFEYLSIYDAENLSGSFDFTLAMLVKASPYSDYDLFYSSRTIVDKGDDYALIFYPPTNSWVATANSTNAIYSGESPENQWQTVFLYRDTTSFCIQVGANTPVCETVAGVAGGTPFYLAKGDADLYWDGQIDTVAFWSRSITGDEKTSLLSGFSCWSIANTTPTPTSTAAVTPTPGVGVVALPGGEQMYLDQTITWGDVGVYVLLLSVLGVVILAALVFIALRYLGRDRG